MLQSIRFRLVASFLAAWAVFVLTISTIVWLAANDVAHNIVAADMNAASLRITRLAFQYTIAGRPAALVIEPLVMAQIADLHVLVRVTARPNPFGAFPGSLLLPPDEPPAITPGVIPIGPALQAQVIPIGEDRVEIFPDYPYLAAVDLQLAAVCRDHRRALVRSRLVSR